MTEAKPAEFAKGDKVTSKGGVKLVVIGQASPGSAVHAESGPGVKPYVNSFYAADSLKKTGSKQTKTKPADEAGDYVVTFKLGSGPDYLVTVEGAANEADAIGKAEADDSYAIGSELVGVEKVAA